MATHTRFPLICSCGHEGAIIMKENDQPYSKGWEKYTLKELDGDEFYIEPSCSIKTAIQNTRPYCPICGNRLTHDNLKNS